MDVFLPLLCRSWTSDTWVLQSYMPWYGVAQVAQFWVALTLNPRIPGSIPVGIAEICFTPSTLTKQMARIVHLYFTIFFLSRSNWSAIQLTTLDTGISNWGVIETCSQRMASSIRNNSGNIKRVSCQKLLFFSTDSFWFHWFTKLNDHSLNHSLAHACLRIKWYIMFQWNNLKLMGECTSGLSDYNRIFWLTLNLHNSLISV